MLIIAVNYSSEVKHRCCLTSQTQRFNQTKIMFLQNMLWSKDQKLLREFGGFSLRLTLWYFKKITFIYKTQTNHVSFIISLYKLKQNLIELKLYHFLFNIGNVKVWQTVVSSHSLFSLSFSLLNLCLSLYVYF